MMRRTARPGAKRRWLAGLGTLSLALATSACTPPPHAAVLKCSGSNFAEVDVKKDCNVNIERFDRQTSATIRVDTRRRQAFVKGHFTVERGTVRIVLRGSAGPAAEAVASPGAPATFEGTVRLRRPDSEFHLRFHPEGEAAGLRGQVSYEAR